MAYTIDIGFVVQGLRIAGCTKTAAALEYGMLAYEAGMSLRNHAKKKKYKRVKKEEFDQNLEVVRIFRELSERANRLEALMAAPVFKTALELEYIVDPEHSDSLDRCVVEYDGIMHDYLLHQKEFKEVVPEPSGDLFNRMVRLHDEISLAEKKLDSAGV